MLNFLTDPIPLAQWVSDGTDWLTNTFSGLFSVIQKAGDIVMGGMTTGLLLVPPLVMVLLITLAAYFISDKKWGLTFFTFIGLLFIYNQNLWTEMMNTLTLVIISSLVSIIIGIPLGILMSKSEKAQSIITPVLDFMQTMPGFVYLIPAVAFFGIGMVPGVFASVIFALPPTVRMTNLGIRQVPTELVEASDSFGGTGSQKLFKLELPLAKSTIFAGINQTIMLALSMVVIASMIGAPGLGQGVLSAVQRSQVGDGFVNGLALVVLAIIMDRFTQNMNKPKTHKLVKTPKQRKIVWGAVLVALAAFIGYAVFDSMTVEKKETVNLAYVEWDTEIASTTVVSEVLKDMGYDVKMTPLDNAIMWEAVANGEADGMVAAWLPTTHGPQYEKFQDQVEDLGPNLEGARLGLVVPQYMDVDSIEDLTDQAGQRIVGIEPGAGVVNSAEATVAAYSNLADWDLVTSSSGAMTTELANAISNEEEIVITGWSPHWMFSRYDLKYLEDPKGTMGGEESINTMVRQGLQDDMPDVYYVLDNFSWDLEDIESVMLEIENGTDTVKAARDWIDANPEKVESWTGGREQANAEGSIEEAVNYTITGIEPGAGVTEAAHSTMDAYENLQGWTLQESSTAGMLASLQQAIRKEEPIIITGWTPHWIFEEYDLKMLEDPKGTMGGEEEIRTIARKGLKEEHPEAYKIIDNFNWTLDDMQEVMNNGVDRPFPEVVEEWITANSDKVSEWTQGTKKSDGETLELVSTPWDTERASSELIKQVLEGQGYKVKMTDVEPAIMFQAVASGQADFSVAPWLPLTHQSFYEQYGDQIDDLGANLNGARNGFVVPSYVEIDSIEDLNPKP